jgi:TRAP-type C4-dicarboxylate transport system permease small subunit
MRPASRRLRHLFAAAMHASLGAMAAALVLMTLVQVVLRYFFASPLVWVEEASVMLLLLMTWVGAALLWLQRGHMAVDILTKSASPIAQGRFRLGCDLASIPVGLLIATLTWNTVEINRGMELAGLNIDSTWKYMPVVAGGILLALAGALNAFDRRGAAEAAAPEGP